MNYKRLKKLLPKRLYHYIDTLHKYKPVSFDVLRAKYDVKILKDKDLLYAAKKLHAKVYIDRGYITKSDIRNGVMHEESDPYQHHAEYFGVIDRDSGEVVAVARQIYRPKKSVTLPVFKHTTLSKSYSHLHHSQTVEISAFVKRRGIDSRALLLLFHAMLQHSKNERHRYWLIACDKDVYSRLKALFGPVIRKVGHTTFYMGSYVVPAEIDIDKAPKYLKFGYRVSLPPLRQLRAFLYSSFTEKSERKQKGGRITPKSMFWDAYSNSYDGLMYFYPYRHLVEHVIDRVLENSDEPKRVLDLGCGTGNVSIELLSRTTTTKIDAVDWSSQMLKHLELKTRDDRLRTFERDLILYLQRSRKKYDIIIMNNVLYTIEDRRRLWRLLYSHLNDDGRIVIANPRTGDSKQLLKEHIKHQSLFTILRPALVKVWIFDFVISLFGLATTSYNFTQKSELLEQVASNGFVVDGHVEYCYGGHENGIDILLSIRKVKQGV